STIYPATYYTVNHDSPLHLEGFIYKKKLARDVKRLLNLLPSPPRSVLDIGCGDALKLLEFRAELGDTLELAGIDLQVAAGVRARADSAGIKLYEANVEGDLSAIPDRAFDLIIMSQLVEHLRDPGRVLSELGRKLSDHGTLVIETPNPGGLDFRLFGRRFWGG